MSLAMVPFFLCHHIAACHRFIHPSAKQALSDLVQPCLHRFCAHDLTRPVRCLSALYPTTGSSSSISQEQ
jgi:hypothetical protein